MGTADHGTHKNPLRSYGRSRQAGWKFSHIKKWLIDFSNFQVNISTNDEFHPGRRDENNHTKARETHPA